MILLSNAHFTTKRDAQHCQITHKYIFQELAELPAWSLRNQLCFWVLDFLVPPEIHLSQVSQVLTASGFGHRPLVLHLNSPLVFTPTLEPLVPTLV